MKMTLNNFWLDAEDQTQTLIDAQILQLKLKP